MFNHVQRCQPWDFRVFAKPCFVACEVLVDAWCKLIIIIDFIYHLWQKNYSGITI